MAVAALLSFATSSGLVVVSTAWESVASTERRKIVVCILSNGNGLY